MVKANAKCFVVTFNTVDALLYMEDMGPMTFYGCNDKSHHLSYAMAEGSPIQDNNLSGPIFTFAKDFEQDSDDDP